MFRFQSEKGSVFTITTLQRRINLLPPYYQSYFLVIQFKFLGRVATIDYSQDTVEGAHIVWILVSRTHHMRIRIENGQYFNLVSRIQHIRHYECSLVPSNILVRTAHLDET